MKNLLILPVLLLTLLVGTPAFSADFQKGLTAARSGDFATALREWEPLAKQGDAGAQFNLGILYRLGKGLPQDDKPMLTLDKARHPLSVMQKLLEHVDRFLNSGLRRTPPKKIEALFQLWGRY